MRGGACPRTRSHITLLSKQLPQADRVVSWIPAAGISEATQELPSELGIVAVLTEGKRGMRALPRPTAAKPGIHVVTSDVSGLGFDYESERITQRLTQKRAGEALGWIKLGSD
jgi:hypothetical protein